MARKEKLPAIHIYIGDWLKDPIAGCSLEAQGLWLRLMFVMHESERYGHLYQDGSSTPPAALARRCGCTVEQLLALLTELASAGVPSRTPEGIIYSRRMVRDAELRRIRAKAGKLGGRPPSENVPKSKRKAKVKQNPDNEDEDVVVSGLFEELWGNYPEKDGKKAAKLHFEATVKTAEDAKKIKLALKNYLNSKRVRDGYVKNGSTWFNNWTDWVPIDRPKPPPAAPKPPEPDPMLAYNATLAKIREMPDPDRAALLAEAEKSQARAIQRLGMEKCGDILEAEMVSLYDQRNGSQKQLAPA